jgi:hypothetical protein
VKHIKEHGAPNSKYTVGEVGDFYTDLDTERIYKCTFVHGEDGKGDISAVNDVKYTWSFQGYTVPSKGGVSSWNDLTNKPFGVEQAFEPIVWDGNTEGRDSIDLSMALGYPAGSVVFHKISSQLLSEEELASANYCGTINGARPETKTEVFVSTITYTEGVIWGCTLDEWMYMGTDEERKWVSGKILCAAHSGDFTAALGTTIPSVGMYALQEIGAPYTLEINGDVFHTIDHRFLPDNVATTEYVDSLIAGAIGGSY